MHEPTEAERYLLDEIRRGSDEAWSQLVDRYQGRLIAFARSRIPSGNQAEDLVQDTFLHFLRSLGNYRAQASVETYLFVILRRRLAELHRGRLGKVFLLPFPSPMSGESDEADNSLPAPDPTASWYLRRDEQRDAARAALTAALRSVIQKMHEKADLRDLQLLEVIFYAQWPNQRIAAELGEDAGQVALLKHRWIKQLRDRIAQRIEHRAGKASLPWITPEALDSLLTEIWEEERPSCPKRSTVGGYVLCTLDDPWQAYVHFHINRLGCPFCRANLDDLQKQNRQDPAPLRHRILQSTVGFLRSW